MFNNRLLVSIVSRTSSELTLVAGVGRAGPQQKVSIIKDIKDDPSPIESNVDVGLQAIDTGIEALSAFLAAGGERSCGVSEKGTSDLSDLIGNAS